MANLGKLMVELNRLGHPVNYAQLERHNSSNEGIIETFANMVDCSSNEVLLARVLFLKGGIPQEELTKYETNGKRALVLFLSWLQEYPL